MLVRHGDWVKAELPRTDNAPTYVCRNDQGTIICIYIVSYAREDGLNFNINIAVINEAVAAISGQFNFVCGDVVFEGGVSNDILKRDRFSRISNPPIKCAIDAMNRINEFEQALFPSINHAFTIKGLDQLVNGEIDPRYRDYLHNDAFKPQCLIVARLAGNPNFEALVTSLEEKPGRFGNAMVWNEEWPKLVKYLREEVKPIV